MRLSLRAEDISEKRFASTVDITMRGNLKGSFINCLLIFFLAKNVLAQAFQKEDLGCVPNQDGPNCPKHWRFSGGPGYVGQRVGADTKIFCSPSCVSSSNPKICSLIVVLHGIYMDPGSMVRKATTVF